MQRHWPLWSWRPESRGLSHNPFSPPRNNQREHLCRYPWGIGTPADWTEVRPDAQLASMAGLALGSSGGITVDERGQTSDPDIYAVGDAVEKADSVGGGSSLIALANIANRQGRRVADDICGLAVRPTHSLGTAIVKVFGVTAATTGWNEQRLRAAGRRFRTLHSHPMNHAGYYPGAEPMSLKLLFDPDEGTILGAQGVGGTGVDKGIDVLATAMAGSVRADARLLTSSWPMRPPSRRPRIRSTCSATWPRMSSLESATSSSQMNSATFSTRAVRSLMSALQRSTPRDPSRGASTCRSIRYARTLRASATACSWSIARSGQRGHTATSLLHELGLKARNLDGGYRTWVAADAARAMEPYRLAKTANQ